MQEPWNSKYGASPIVSTTSSRVDFRVNIIPLKRRIRKMLTETHNDGQPEGHSMKRAKIMVVDDDPDLRQALSLRLRANHFDTINVCDGYSAIAMAQKEHPHLIILDLGLPAGDGFTVLKNLQQYPALSVIPVIVLTARDPEG